MSSYDPFQRPQEAPQPPAGPFAHPQAHLGQAHPGQAPLAPSTGHRWRPMVLSGLAGAVAGAVLSAGVAVPLTLVLTEGDSAPASTAQGAGDATTGDSTDGWGSDVPGAGGGYGPGGTAQGSTAGTGVEATDEQSEGVVLIESTMRGGEGAGTGMVVDSDGLVLTNYHVVEDSTQVTVTLAADGTSYDAELVGADETADVALLQLEDASGLDTVTLDGGTLGGGGDAVVGAEITAIGNAGGQGYLSAMTGSVTGLERSIATSDGMEFGATDARLTGLLETDAAVVPGYSGGPMLDDEGEVVGISTAASTARTQSYAVPIDDAMAIVDRIEDGDESGTVRIGPGAYLGIGARSVDGGAGLAEVESGGPADEAGLVAGDTITALGGRSVDSLSDLTAALATYEPGEPVTLSWTTAAGAERSASVTLGESPVN